MLSINKGLENLDESRNLSVTNKNAPKNSFLFSPTGGNTPMGMTMT